MYICINPGPYQRSRGGPCAKLLRSPIVASLIQNMFLSHKKLHKTRKFNMKYISAFLDTLMVFEKSTYTYVFFEPLIIYSLNYSCRILLRNY